MKEHTMRFEVTPNVIKNPNAPKHEIVSIDDLYQVCTEKNIHRLLRDLKKTFQISIAMEKAVHATAKAKNPEYKAEKFKVSKWDWKDYSVKP